MSNHVSQADTRRVLVGATGGAVAGLLLTTVTTSLLGLALGVSLGALYAATFNLGGTRDGRTLVSHVITAVALAIPGWVLVQATVLHVVADRSAGVDG